MKNLKVINAIKLISNYDVVGEEFPDKELELAIINCDYYVRPGNGRTMFMFFLNRILTGNFDQDLLDPNIPEDYRIPMILVGLVRAFFDKTYFEEQINKPSPKINNTQLKKHVKKLTKVELKDFIILLITGRQNRDLFISNSNSTNMWMRINEECRKIDDSIPPINDGTGAFEKYIGTDPVYFFNYLSTKQIANIICDSIDKHICDAEKIAKLIGSSGCAAAQNYLKHLKI